MYSLIYGIKDGTFDYWLETNVVEETKPEIKKVIYHKPATIILWNDGTKTVAKCDDVDKYDPEIGFKICVAKKFVTGKRWNWMLDIIYEGEKKND